jgi:hypothetical protein
VYIDFEYLIFGSVCIFMIGVFMTAYFASKRKDKTVVTLPVANYDEELVREKRKLEADLSEAESLRGKAMHPRQFMESGDEIEVIGEMPVDYMTDFNVIVMCRDPRSGIGFIFVNLSQHTIQGVDEQKLPTDRRVSNGRYRYEEIETKSTKAIELMFIRVNDVEEPDPLERRRLHGDLQGIGSGEGLLDLTRDSDLSDEELTDLFPPADGNGQN